jgi:hypothetical protein
VTVRTIPLLALCVFAFTACLLASWRWGSRSSPVVVQTRASEGGDATVTAREPQVHLQRAVSALASAQSQEATQRADGGVTFINRLYDSNLKAAVTLKNGIRRGLTDIHARTRDCIGTPPAHNLRLEYRYWVESHPDRVLLSRLQVRDASGTPLPPEVTRCFAQFASSTYVVTAAQILPAALRARYDPQNFFVEAAFEDAESFVLFAPRTVAPAEPAGRDR